MTNYNSASAPTESGLKLTNDPGGKKIDCNFFKKIVRCLMYQTATRPNIMYVVSLINRYMEHPIQLHLLAAKIDLHYLQGISKFGLFYQKGEKS